MRAITSWLARLGLLLVLCTSCSNTKKPFAPLTIPNIYSVRPPEPVNARELRDALLKLHEPDQTPYKIMPGDQFNFSVYEHVVLDVLQIMVTPDGYISVPLVGPVKIGGLSLPDATNLLAERFSEFIRRPIVSLIPYRVSGYNFTIVGRVNYPGCYPISIGNTRLIDAIAIAKGLSQGLFNGDTVELADLDNAYVSRGGKILPVSFTRALRDGDPLHNVPLKNNDYIYIPSVMNRNVVLLGEVQNNTYVGFREGLTVLQALTFGHGLKETYNSEIKIIRGGMKNPVLYTVNLRDMLAGRVMDFPLQADDIIYIPPDGVSDWNIMVRKILPSLQSLTLVFWPFNALQDLSNGN